VRSPGGGPDQGSALHRFAPQRRDAAHKFRGELELPTAESICPCFDRVFVNRVIVKSASAAPAVVINKGHGRFPPCALAENAPFQDGRHDIVSILKNVCSDDEIFANDALNRITPSVDQWLQVLDDNGRKGPNHGR
jgi:hypothetical protein